MTTGRINQVARPPRQTGADIRTGQLSGQLSFFQAGFERHTAQEGQRPMGLAASKTKNAGEVALSMATRKGTTERRRRER